MIGFLRGKLLSREGAEMVTIDVGGVGYDVRVTPQTSALLGSAGSAVSLRIFTRVREDAITLYGFRTLAEKETFETVLGAHGVGPSIALALMATYSPDALGEIVATEDAAAMAKVPGVGKRTAARLLVDLQSKFAALSVGLGGETDTEVVAVDSDARSARSDVAAALAELGYSSDEVRSVMSRLPSEGETNELLKTALKELAVM
jgi:Holliday junction DNA helicase RuvA